MTARGRRDLLATAAAFVLLLALDFSGVDMALAQMMASPAGFMARESPLLARLHDAGRLLAWGLLALLLADALRTPALPPTAPGQQPAPTRGQRLQWLGVVLATAVLVPGIKRLSRSSCPWDLAPFGGSVPYVPHWLLGVADGGPGHCFPSGHAAGVLAFIGVYFLWRDHRPALARALAAGVWLLGAGFGLVQMLRGAHFLSHVLWAAWACWALAALAAAVLARPATATATRARTDRPA